MKYFGYYSGLEWIYLIASSNVLGRLRWMTFSICDKNKELLVENNQFHPH